MALKGLALFVALHLGMAGGCASRPTPAIGAQPAVATSSPLLLSSSPFPSTSRSTQRAGAYAMDDLRALAKESAWLELAIHLDDIRPSERDASWAQLAEQAAVGATARYLRDKEPNAAEDLVDAMIERIPALASSPMVSRARVDAGLAALPACYRERTSVHCTERMLVAVKRGATDAQAFEVGKIVAQSYGGGPSMPFFERALTGPSARARCDDEAFLRAMFEALEARSPGPEDAKRLRETCRALRRH